MSLQATPLMVWGHRGHRHHRYDGRHGLKNTPHENSMLAYQQVLRMVTGVECDVVQSMQHTPFLVHDTLFSGITRYGLKAQLDEASQTLLGDRYIFQLTDDELKQMHLKDGQNLPLLSDLLTLMPEYADRFLNLELKGPHVADSAVRVVEQAIRRNRLSASQVVFSSYNLPTLQNLRLNVGTRFQISVMLTPADLELSQMYPNWPLAEQNAYYVPFSVQALQRADIREIQPDFLHIEIHSLSNEALANIREMYPDTKIILWCAGEMHPLEHPFFADRVLQFASSKMLFAVISDFPEAMQKVLRERGVAVKMPNNPYDLCG